MINHELNCSCNPINKDACLGCCHCQEVEKEIYFDTYTGEDSRTVKSFKCIKLDKTMYPHKAQRIEERYPESFEDEIVMPNECEHFEFTW